VGLPKSAATDEAIHSDAMLTAGGQSNSATTYEALLSDALDSATLAAALRRVRASKEQGDMRGAWKVLMGLYGRWKEGEQPASLIQEVPLSAVYCVLSAVCYLLPSACCLQSAGCWLLSALCCLLSALCFLLYWRWGPVRQPSLLLEEVLIAHSTLVNYEFGVRYL
jgi:hypothetical protein